MYISGPFFPPVSPFVCLLVCLSLVYLLSACLSVSVSFSMSLLYYSIIISYLLCLHSVLLPHSGISNLQKLEWIFNNQVRDDVNIFDTPYYLMLIPKQELSISDSGNHYCRGVFTNESFTEMAHAGLLTVLGTVASLDLHMGQNIQYRYYKHTVTRMKWCISYYVCTCLRGNKITRNYNYSEEHLQPAVSLYHKLVTLYHKLMCTF